MPAMVAGVKTGAGGHNTRGRQSGVGDGGWGVNHTYGGHTYSLYYVSGPAVGIKHTDSFNPLPRLGSRYHYPHFMSGETEAQIVQIGFESRVSGSRVWDFNH